MIDYSVVPRTMPGDEECGDAHLVRELVNLFLKASNWKLRPSMWRIKSCMTTRSKSDGALALVAGYLGASHEP